MAELKHLDTTYIDTYLVDVPLHALPDHPAIRATRVVVELDHVKSDHESNKTKVRISVTGERIVQNADGSYASTGGHERVLGLAENQDRYDLCREAILHSFHLHGLHDTEVITFAFQKPWEEYSRHLDVGAVNMGGSVSRYLISPDGGADVEDERF